MVEYLLAKEISGTDTVHTQRNTADSTGNQTQILSHVAGKHKSVISQTHGSQSQNE